MGRRRRGRRIDGWLVVDKPAGMTSAHVVARVRRLLDARKVGHAGTLDPMATGLLPVALGEATKTITFVMGGAKTYRFTVRWGEARSTDDADGEVTATSSVRPTAEEIEAALGGFLGEIEQVPPAFSAVKVEGRRAYALAREEKPVKLEPRTVRVDRFRLVEVPDADHAVFEVVCGKGTYIRSLARDLARRLGTFGHVAAIRRTAVGPFAEKDAISLDKLESLGHSAAALGQLLPVETVLDDIPALALTEVEADRLRQGRAIQVLRNADKQMVDGLADGEIVCAMSDGRLVALTRLDQGPVVQLHPVRVLHT